MLKNKHEFNAEPQTPTQRAEALLQKAERQFGRFAGLLPEHATDTANKIIVGGYLVVGPNPIGKPVDPMFVEEVDLLVIAKHFGGRKMQYVSFCRDENGKTDFKAQLEPIEVDEYVQRLKNNDLQLLSCDVVLTNSETGPEINGVPVDVVDEISGDGIDSEGTLTRLERIMGDVEKSTHIRYPKASPTPK